MDLASRRRPRRLLLPLALVLAVGCARSFRLEDEAVGLDAFLRAFGEWECAQTLRCGSPGVTHRRLSAEGMDLTRPMRACYEEGLGWRLDATLAGVRAGRVAYDARRAAACLAALPDAPSCADLQAERVVPGACEGVFAGTVPAGEPCAHDVECGAGHACLGEGCPRLCTPLPPPGAPCPGGACDLDRACVEGVCQAPGGFGARCGGDADCVARMDCFDGRCVPSRTTGGRAVGARCELDRPCAPGLGCVVGACVALPERGEDCGDRRVCADGSRCATDGVGWTCQPWAGFGDACRTDADCAAVEGRCLERDDAAPRFVCGRRGLEGDACVTTFAEPPCLEGSCVDGRCSVDRDGLGLPRDGSCRAPVPPDHVSPCAPGLECRRDRSVGWTRAGACVPACDPPAP